jgi:hypothetical protein
MDTNELIAQAETNLERKLDWIGRHDTRVAFSAGIIVAMLGVLTSASTAIKIWHWYLYGLLGLTTILLLIALGLLYLSQYPRTESQNSSLIYFGTVSKLKLGEFKQRTVNRTKEDYLDDLLSQVHINACIINTKYCYLKSALVLLAIAIIPWLASIFLSKIYLS